MAVTLPVFVQERDRNALPLYRCGSIAVARFPGGILMTTMGSTDVGTSKGSLALYSYYQRWKR